MRNAFVTGGLVGRRFFRYGELPLVLLSLVAQEPMSGYELMTELGRLFPSYRPSPGSVYPALEALGAEGLVEAAHRNGATVHAPTPKGRKSLESRREALAEIEARTGAHLQVGTALDAAIARFSRRIRALAGRLDIVELEERLAALATELEAEASRRTE